MHMVQKTIVENRHSKMESICGASFWSMCHGYNSLSQRETAEVKKHHCRSFVWYFVAICATSMSVICVSKVGEENQAVRWSSGESRQGLLWQL